MEIQQSQLPLSLRPQGSVVQPSLDERATGSATDQQALRLVDSLRDAKHAQLRRWLWPHGGSVRVDETDDGGDAELEIADEHDGPAARGAEQELQEGQRGTGHEEVCRGPEEP